MVGSAAKCTCVCWLHSCLRASLRDSLCAVCRTLHDACRVHAWALCPLCSKAWVVNACMLVPIWYICLHHNAWCRCAGLFQMPSVTASHA